MLVLCSAYNVLAVGATPCVLAMSYVLALSYVLVT